jgi:hypothetical protein
MFDRVVFPVVNKDADDSLTGCLHLHDELIGRLTWPRPSTSASSPGANYTWTNGKFAWSSATAGKNWTSAYPAVYTLNVATDLSFSELSQEIGIKQAL